MLHGLLHLVPARHAAPPGALDSPQLFLAPIRLSDPTLPPPLHQTSVIQQPQHLPTSAATSLNLSGQARSQTVHACALSHIPDMPPVLLTVNSWGHHLLLADSGVPPGCSAPPPCCERDAKRQHTCTPSSAVGTPTHRNIPIYFLTQPPVGTLSVASQRSHRSQCGIQSSIPRRVRQEPRL